MVMRMMAYIMPAMFSPRSTTRKTLAFTLPVSLLCFLIGCVSACASHLEEAATADVYVLSITHTDEDCWVTPASATALPERQFSAPQVSGSLGLAPPLRLSETDFRLCAHQSIYIAPHDPPFTRPTVLRI